MSIEEKTLPREREIPSPSAKQRFAGRPVLLSGLLEGSRHKAEDDIIASRFVLETVMQLVKAKEIMEGYEFLIIEQAAYISQARAVKADAKPPPMHVPRKPINEEEAVLSGIANIGLEPRLKAKRVAPSGNFVFSIEIDGDVCSVMLPKDLMSKEDPVAFAEEYARKQGIRTRAEATKEMLERRRSSRPDARSMEALGIDAQDLGKRSLTYEGQENGLHHFTYLPEQIGTTFTISTSFMGKSLLAELDRRIFSTHIQYQKPFVAPVLEEGTASVRSTPRIESIAQGDVKAIAKALDLLVCGTEIDESLVPAEYKDAWTRMKASGQFGEYGVLFNRGVLSREEAAMFMESFESVSHPADGVVRAWLRLHLPEGGKLSGEDSASFRSLIDQARGTPSGLCERALKNICEAYALITGDARALSSDTETLEAGYLEMTVRLRKAVAEILPPEMLKLVD